MFDESWNLLTGPAEMGGFVRDWLTEKKNSDLPAGQVPGGGSGGGGRNGSGDGGAGGAGGAGGQGGAGGEGGSSGQGGAGGAAPCPMLDCPLVCDGFDVDQNGCPLCSCSDCAAHGDMQTCEDDLSCVWLGPGCGTPALDRAGCYAATRVGCTSDAGCTVDLAVHRSRRESVRQGELRDVRHRAGDPLLKRIK